MSPIQILAWAELGAKLISVLGVPIAKVIQLIRDSGGTDEEVAALMQHWAALTTTIEGRIAVLKAQIAARPND